MHGTWWCTKTRVPTATVAPAPASTTSPTGSWPSTTGARGSWYHDIRSLPQSPQARTRTTSSPGPATGSGRSSSSIRPAPWYIATITWLSLCGRGGRDLGADVPARACSVRTGDPIRVSVGTQWSM